MDIYNQEFQISEEPEEVLPAQRESNDECNQSGRQQQKRKASSHNEPITLLDSTVIEKVIELIGDRNQVEKTIGSTNVKSLIGENLKRAAVEETHLRRTTVTFEKSLTTSEQAIVDAISTEWISKNSRPDADIWFDKDSVYVSFISLNEKQCFLQWLRESNTTNPLKYTLVPMNKDGSHFRRKPVRLILPKVRSHIEADRIHRTLSLALDKDAYLSNPKSGAQNLVSKTRSITFLADGAAFKRIFLDMNRSVPYISDSGTLRTKLFFKINARPYMCMRCNAIGKHTCKGNCCSKCGRKNHTHTRCTSPFKVCSNCKKKGHGARDPCCPAYIWALTRLLISMDIPVEFYEMDSLRNLLSNALMLK